MATALADIRRLSVPKPAARPAMPLFRATDISVGTRLVYMGVSDKDEPVFIVTGVLRQSKCRWSRRRGTAVETIYDKVEVTCGEEQRTLGALYVADSARWHLVEA